MNLRFVFILSLMAVSFADTRVLAGTADPEFMPYVRQIRSDIVLFCAKDEIQYKNFTISFWDQNGKSAGTCTRDHDGFIIQIDPGAWQRMDEAMRYQLLAHELSHCMLHMDHSIDAKNYMFPVLKTNLTIEETRTQMFSEISRACSGHSPSTMSLQRMKMFLGY